MAKTIRVTVSDEASEKLDSIKEQLSARGVKKTLHGNIISDLIISLNEKKISSIIEEHTPLEWKITEALKDPEKRKLLEKSLNKKLKNEQN